MRILLRVVGLAFFLCAWTNSYPHAQTPIGSEVTTPAQGLTSSPQSVDDTRTRQSAEREDVSKLRSEIETIKNIIFYGGGFLAFIVFVLTLQSSILAWMSDRRTSESHALGIKGETTAQNRAQTIHDKFLEDSHKTIGLVNATLQLAKDATESTTRVFEERALTNLRLLDERAKSLLSDVTIERARDLVRDVAQQEAIKSLAQEITLFESNRLFFAEKFPLTPHCKFVRGVYAHMSQDYSDAIKEWESIRIDTRSSQLLVGLAAYWIAIEYDSLGNFEKAISTFESARNVVDGVAKYDIERLIIESTFSKLPIEEAESLVGPLEALLEKAEREGEGRARTYVVRRINIALGNILLQVGKHQKKTELSQLAGKNFEKAIKIFRAISDYDQWALLGLAEALYFKGELEDATRIFAGRAKANAVKEFGRRKEPRSQVLAKTTELICCVRAPTSDDSVVAIHETLTRTLNDVHPRLTIYSAFEKRNVTKEMFEGQLQEFMLESKLGLE